MKPLITEAMAKLDRKGLVYYAARPGGCVKDILKALHEAVAELEAEAQSRGLIAEGRYPMFEHGTVMLFHNDHTVGNRMRGQRSYKEPPPWGKEENQR